MPAWNDLLGEIQTQAGKHDAVRRKHLKRLSDYTKRNTIIYYSGWLDKPGLVQDPNFDFSISDADKNGFMAVVHKLDRSKGLDLLLHTPGGDMAATESLVEYLKTMFDGDIRAIIPQLAMSAGTIIALSCRKIIMGKGSSIGPIDPQFGNIAATGILQEFERVRKEIKKDPSNALLWNPILQKINPAFITECENAVEWSKQMADRFLAENMFQGDHNAKERISSIITHLAEKKNTKTHGRHIGLDEAKDIFGEHLIELETDQKFQDLVLSIHHATTITLQGTACYKLIENQHGRANAKIAQMRVVE